MVRGDAARGEEGEIGNRAITRMTIDAFLAWQRDQDQRYELVGGEPLAMAGAKLRHDRVTGNAFSEIRRQLRIGGSLCDAFTADIGIRTPVASNVGARLKCHSLRKVEMTPPVLADTPVAKRHVNQRLR